MAHPKGNRRVLAPRQSPGSADGSFVAGAGYPGTGAGLRMLVYSHDTFGLGHLRRCLKISQGMKTRFPDLSILLVTGSPQVHRYSLPPGIDYVKLPAVRKTADEQYEPRHMRTSFQRIFNIRSRLLLETTKEYSPHLLLVDHSPLGMKSEMRPSLEWLRAESPETVVVLGLRDILDEPEKIVRQWREQEVFERLREYYDEILIYGSPAVFDPVAAYEFPPDIAARTRFCGYVADDHAAARNGNGVKRGARKFVLVTTGGGDGAGEAVVGTYLDMLDKYRARIDFDSLIITGPFVAEEFWRKSRARARGLPVTIRRFVRQTRPYLQRSDLVVATGGYNTSTEAMTYGARALIIPRIMYRDEQLLRARRLSELGLVTLLHPDEATPEILFAAISRQLESAEAPLARAREAGTIGLDGAGRVAEHCRGIFARITGFKEAAR